MLKARSVAKAIEELRALPSLGGTGFAAKNIVHVLQDADANVKFFQWVNNDYRNTGVGPGTRRLVNLMSGLDLHVNQNGGNDEFYMEQLRAVTAVTKKYLPSSLQPSLSKVRVVQFNMCKLMCCLRFVLRGRVGIHGRKRAPTGDDDPKDDDTEDVEELEIFGNLASRPKVKRARKSS